MKFKKNFTVKIQEIMICYSINFFADIRVIYFGSDKSFKLNEIGNKKSKYICV